MSDEPAATVTSADAPPRPSSRGRAVRHFGRFQLLALLGRSARTMAWRVADPRSRQALVLVLPRHQPGAALEAWTATLKKAARVRHPQLATVVEQGVVDCWPYAAYDARDTPTLSERLTEQGQPSVEVATWGAALLEGLAFAHEAGLAHHDLQPYLLLLADNGQPRLMGVEVALDATIGYAAVRGSVALDAPALAVQRAAAERDVLCAGLLMHHALAGAPPLDQPDTAIVADAMPPGGREIVRLPWATAQPIAEPLRAIVNRATDRQARHRYRNARTLARALQGWLQTDADEGGGALALLLDRLHSVGLLPASPGAADRAARMALMVRERTSELAQVVLQDIALSFEMLRAVNTAQVRGAQVAGSGPVLTVRRAIAMLGLDGVRHAALALRPWPGPLTGEGEAALARLFERVRRAARIAQALRPPGYDAELVFLVTLLQNLGRLAIQYHFPDDAEQIRRLMQPAPPTREGEREEPGMSEEAAAYAVLGTDVEAVGAALARHWGLDAAVQHIVRRLPVTAPVRAPDNDDDVLRAVASCANETVDALALPPVRQADALQRIANRYARALGIGLRELQAALANRAPVPDAVAGAGAGAAP
jgi:eukaryotic-like serine/threonine-protein kinase